MPETTAHQPEQTATVLRFPIERVRTSRREAAAEHEWDFSEHMRDFEDEPPKPAS